LIEEVEDNASAELALVLVVVHLQNLLKRGPVYLIAGLGKESAGIDSLYVPPLVSCQPDFERDCTNPVISNSRRHGPQPMLVCSNEVL
jgi:hypothetical protein